MTLRILEIGKFFRKLAPQILGLFCYLGGASAVFFFTFVSPLKAQPPYGPPNGFGTTTASGTTSSGTTSSGTTSGGGGTAPYWEVVEVRTGTYTPTNSDNPYLAPSTYANPANAYQVGGVNTNVNNHNTASAALSGSHKFTFTWKGGTGSAPIPKSVVIKIDGQAGWSAPKLAPSGTCDITGGEGILVTNDVTLPKTASNPNNTGGVHKVWYSVKNTPPATFDITVSTSANASATGNSNPDSQGSVSVGAGVMVGVTSIGVNLTGTTVVGGQDNILIGQGCNANLATNNNAQGLITPPAGYGPPNPYLQSLPGAGVTLGSTVNGVTTGYTWTVGGEKFDRYEVNTTNASTGTVIAYDEAELSKPIPRRWIWRVPNAATTVKGEADIKVVSSLQYLRQISPS
jgi:hypothetical protein